MSLLRVLPFSIKAPVRLSIIFIYTGVCIAMIILSGASYILVIIFVVVLILINSGYDFSFIMNLGLIIVNIIIVKKRFT